jgi:diketogulonate reductase-like aldo/keto reductase
MLVVVENDIADAAVRAVADAVARDTVALLEKFREELGQADRAVDGVSATRDALGAAQVDVLLVPGDVGDDVETVDELVQAAFATGAGIRVVPRHGGPTDGIGAVLRWS